MRILAGDIGGTKTLLAIVEFVDGESNEILRKRYDSCAWKTFDALLLDFLGSEESARVAIDAACIAVAGPVKDACARVTNLPWVIKESSLKSVLNIQKAHLINDFEAIGYGIETLDVEDVLVLQEGIERVCETRAVLGAGTGLGECIIPWVGGRYHVLPSEGGHVDFSPVSLDQMELLNFLKQKYDKVSYERLLSGQGIANIYDFLLSSNPNDNNADRSLVLEQNRLHAPPVISERAMSGQDKLASQSLDLFMQIYGTQAGNLALTTVALGGVYIAGGIAAKLKTLFFTGAFMSAFNENEKMGSLLQSIPVKLITNPEVGLNGAAFYGRTSSVS